MKLYGVVIDDGGVDEAGTHETRRSMRSRRYHPRVVEGDDDYDELGRRIGPLVRETAERIGASSGDMIEYVGRAAAPLRAWVRLVEEGPSDAVPLGPIGRSIINVQPGDEIWLRRLPIKAPTL